jgi:hypothetical protein
LEISSPSDEQVGTIIFGVLIITQKSKQDGYFFSLDHAKCLARFYIKIEKIFNIARPNGAVGDQQNFI